MYSSRKFFYWVSMQTMSVVGAGVSLVLAASQWASSRELIVTGIIAGLAVSLLGLGVCYWLESDEAFDRWTKGSSFLFGVALPLEAQLNLLKISNLAHPAFSGFGLGLAGGNLLISMLTNPLRK